MPHSPPEEDKRKHKAAQVKNGGFLLPETPTYPGVYIEEIPSDVHPITGVATSIGAFIDYFPRGPAGPNRNYAVQILSAADFERIFGGLDARSEASYAIQQFFLNGGTEAYVIRVGDGMAAAAVTLMDKVGGSDIVTVTTGERIASESANNPGLWGNNLRVEVDYNTTDSANSFNLTVSEIDPVIGQVLNSETYRNLNMTAGTPQYAVDVVNQSSRLIQLTFVAAGRPATTGTLGAGLAVPPAIPVLSGTKTNDVFNITVDPDGTGAHVPKVWQATLAYPSPAPTDYASLRPILEAAIRGATPTDPNDANNPLAAPLLAAATV